MAREARTRTAAPTQKVMAGTIAGALTVVLVWAVGEIGNVTIPAEVAQSITVILTFATSWFTPPSPDETVVETEVPHVVTGPSGSPPPAPYDPRRTPPLP